MSLPEPVRRSRTTRSTQERSSREFHELERFLNQMPGSEEYVFLRPPRPICWPTRSRHQASRPGSSLQQKNMHIYDPCHFLYRMRGGQHSLKDTGHSCLEMFGLFGTSAGSAWTTPQTESGIMSGEVRGSCPEVRVHRDLYIARPQVMMTRPLFPARERLWGIYPTAPTTS